MHQPVNLEHNTAINLILNDFLFALQTLKYDEKRQSMASLMPVSVVVAVIKFYKCSCFVGFWLLLKLVWMVYNEIAEIY